MCDETTTEIFKDIDKRLQKLVEYQEDLPIDKTIQLSATKPFFIDYRNRKYIFVRSIYPLSLTLEDIGEIPIPALTWTPFNFPPGIRVTAAAQSSAVPLLIRCTNEPLAQADALFDRLATAQSSGLGFTATTGLINQNTGTYPLSVFNPSSSTKDVLIYSVRGSTGTGGGVLFLQPTTVDPAYGALTPLNRRVGGPASVTSCSTTTSSQSNPSTPSATFPSGNLIAPIEAMSNGEVWLLPRGAANGLTAFINTFSNGYSSLSISWIEY